MPNFSLKYTKSTRKSSMKEMMNVKSLCVKDLELESDEQRFVAEIYCQFKKIKKISGKVRGSEQWIAEGVFLALTTTDGINADAIYAASSLSLPEAILSRFCEGEEATICLTKIKSKSSPTGFTFIDSTPLDDSLIDSLLF